MKLLNKLLFATTMVITSSVAVNCGNKNPQPQPGEFTGVPYTTFTIGEITHDCTIGFKYTGDNVEVYWNSDEPTTETTHTFPGKEYFYPATVVIKGNVTSLWFTDGNGNPIGRDNYQIQLISFSNTITTLPKNACLGMYNLAAVFIPGSIMTVGENAFGTLHYNSLYCEPESRPATWSPDWSASPTTPNFVTWGVSLYSDETNLSYLPYDKYGIKVAVCLGYLLAPPVGTTEFKPASKITFKEEEFDVIAILSVGWATNIEKATIPSSVKYIADDAFYGCTGLKTINFEGTFTSLRFGIEMFSYCTSLEKIELPNGLVTIPYDTFYRCDNLTEVIIPNSVKILQDEVFHLCSGTSKDLVVDLTSYKNAEDIAECEYSPFDLSNAQKVTFKYDSTLAVTDFTSKNWPAESSYSSPKFVWEAVPPTSLA